MLKHVTLAFEIFLNRSKIEEGQFFRNCILQELKRIKFQANLKLVEYIISSIVYEILLSKNIVYHKV